MTIDQSYNLTILLYNNLIFTQKISDIVVSVSISMLDNLIFT